MLQLEHICRAVDLELTKDHAYPIALAESIPHWGYEEWNGTYHHYARGISP